MIVANLLGKRFGSLVVLQRAANRVDSFGKSKVYWKCRCDCGKIVDIFSGSLMYDKSKSCGCMRLGKKKKKFYLKKVRNGGVGTGLCEFCGQPIPLRRPADIKTKRFCSRLCSQKAYCQDPSVKCDNCGNDFKRTLSGMKRRNFCSLRCLNESRRDEVSPFRFLHTSIRWGAKKRDIEFSITPFDLKEQWDKQKGKCVYTDWDLVLPNGRKNQSRNPKKASVDRKDNSLGYTKDNIQFVCMMANLAKNDFSEKEFLDLCASVTCKDEMRKKGKESAL